jgi:phosphatidylglycerophosphate synthase
VASSWLMTVTHLGLLGPASSLGAATTVTLIRANLPALGMATPWLAVAAVASDRADGILARRAGPTQFGHYADSLADSAFWAWFAYRHEPDPRVLAAAALAWVAPVAAIVALSFRRGRMVDMPRPAGLRPAAAMQAVLAVRAVRTGWPPAGRTRPSPRPPHDGRR